MEDLQGHNYTLSDIQKYHAGELSSQEKHALEKAALNDPFLADALEGYAFSSNPQSELDNLKHKLNKRVGEKKTGAIFFYWPWIRIAALLVVMAGCGWFLFHIFSSGGRQVALNQSPVLTNKSTDSLSKKILSTPDSVVQHSADNTDFQEQKSSPHVTKKMNSMLLPRKKITATGISDDTQTVTKPILSKTEEFNTEESGKSESLPMAQKQPLTKDALQQKPGDTIRNVNVTLKPVAIPLQEIVIGNGNPKKKNTSIHPVMIDTIEPDMSFSEYDEYITSHQDELSSNPVDGDVELTFYINKNGQPVNISVAKSLCEQCDEEAIRLLKEGPKWKHKGNKKGRIAFRFTGNK